MTLLYFVYSFKIEMRPFSNTALLKFDPIQLPPQEILRHWLSQPAVYGVHIGSFNLLIEDVDNDLRSDANATLEFFDELKAATKEFEDRKGCTFLGGKADISTRGKFLFM